MKNKGFTLVELLAVIAILALLVIIALPNVLKMFNQAKKDTFLTEAKTVYKEISKKYISETMKGNKISIISNDNNKLELESNDLKYKVKLKNDGSIKRFEVSNGNYCISGKFNNLSDLTTDKITEGKCEEISPKNFSTDDWEIIIDAIREGNDGVYNVGDTKEIDLGSYGKHILRIANKSTPSECSGTGFSQSACGFVLEFADVIITHKMNDTNTNVGGWPASSMYTFVNNDIYNALPDEIKNAIIDTTVVSG
ncbi:MAG: type II secretion system GspH family protein, partial [Clostridium sp.]|nr:type II secretion system GspH family protein [Clostridium sp.]